MRNGRSIDNKWTFDQRAAVKKEIDQQMVDTMARIAQLSRKLVTEIGVAEYLVNRKIRHQRDEEEEMPF